MSYIEIGKLRESFYYTKRASNNSVADFLNKNKIITYGPSPEKIKNMTSISDSDYKNAYDILNKIQFCNTCGKKFHVKSLKEKYCSKRCRDIHSKKTFKEGKSIRRVKIDDLSNCSVECLLKELGDIE